jgi:hypothetical protein
MQKIAIKKSASDAKAKHRDAECLAKSAFARIKGTKKLPGDVIDKQDDAQAMQRGCRFSQLELSPPTFHCPSCICKIAALSLLSVARPRLCIGEKHSDAMTKPFGISKINPT